MLGDLQHPQHGAARCQWWCLLWMLLDSQEKCPGRALGWVCCWCWRMCPCSSAPQLPPHPGKRCHHIVDVTTSWMSPLLHLAEWEEPAPLQTAPLTQRTLLFLKGVINFNCQLPSDNVGSAQPRPSPAAGSGSSAGTPPCPQSPIPQEAGAAALHAALVSASSQELKSDLF